MADAPLVLIVKEDVGLSRLLERALAGLGCRTATAGHAAALDIISRLNPDLLLLSPRLPGMPAVDLISQLSKEGPPPPFVVIAGRGGERAAIELMRHGARDCLLEDESLPQVLPSAIERVLEQLRRDRRLTGAEEIVSRLLDELPVVLVSCDLAGGKVTTVVGHSLEVLGHQPDEFVQDPGLLRSIIHQDDREKVTAATEAQQLGDEPLEMEYRINHPTRGVVWIQFHFVLAAGVGGRSLHRDGVLIDVTREKRLTQERQLVDSMLDRARRLESLGVLAGGIAHDFNNLLTIISGNAQFLRETTSLPAAQARALLDIEAAARQAGDMTRSLQAFSHPSKPQSREADAGQLVQEAHRFLRRLIPARIQFRYVPPEEPCPVQADPAQIQQVLVNVCVNARDAIANGGWIEMRVRRARPQDLPAAASKALAPRGYAVIEVADSGSGMDEATLAQVFDPFFTTKPKDQGTGLGLPIVYGIVEAHSGLIDLQSRPGQGTTVRVLIPLAEPSAQPPAAKPAPPLGHGHILVVDDEAMIASLLKTMLESSGYKVSVAHRPSEALQAASAGGEPFRLAVVDYSLPEMNGEDCLAELRKLQPGIRGVLITGMEVGTLQCADTLCLQKPFTAQAIISAVRETLDRSE